MCEAVPRKNRQHRPRPPNRHIIRPIGCYPPHTPSKINYIVNPLNDEIFEICVGIISTGQAAWKSVPYSLLVQTLVEKFATDEVGAVTCSGWIGGGGGGGGGVS